MTGNKPKKDKQETQTRDRYSVVIHLSTETAILINYMYLL